MDKGKSVYSVFFNLSKAFDSVPHVPLIQVLSNFKLPQSLITWFTSCLSDRTQQVAVDGHVSSKMSVISGVPQGSILGPLLFILYMSELPSLLFSSNASIILYANDIVLSQEIYSDSCFSSIQSNINLLASWISSHHLTLNVKKTK